MRSFEFQFKISFARVVYFRIDPIPFPRPLLCERTASANQIAGKWCDCFFGRQIHSVAVPAELFCPFLLYLLNLILSKITISALNSKILMRRYAPFRGRHSVSYMPLATCHLPLATNDMPQTDLSHLAMFADDTAIITQNKRFSVVISNLQHYVSLLELWLTDWKIKVNASKSACLMFTRRPRLPVGLTPVKFLANPSPGGASCPPKAPQDPLHPPKICRQLQPGYAGDHEKSGLNPGRNYQGIPEDSCLHRGRAPRDHCFPKRKGRGIPRDRPYRVKIDSFNRRPGATQCYNCNLFHHSSSNCNIKTRCLKCGEPHKTGDCPIKTKIENPKCINCQQTGHLANSHRCPKFPKPKPKKGEASQNRNSKKENNNNNNIFSTSSATVQKGVSFAKALSNDKENQMAPPLDQNRAGQIETRGNHQPPLKK
ncbi:hypothetical protein TNCV_3422871 [Trichonephila clavipes]|nr:hypothetical protein TNCV_3422871 [Trichonephila clavipes]